ncbi:MAG: aspartate--tRNA(Asn) ligase [Armatimonadota bacterium]
MDRIYVKDTVNYIDKEVSVSGWAHKIRLMGANLAFVVIRDVTGIIQGVCENEELIKKLDGVGVESVLKMTGMIVKEERVSLGVEMKVKDIGVISLVKDEPVVQLNKKDLKAHLDTVLDHRALTLRHPRIRQVFKLQSKILQYFSEFLVSRNFTRICSPKIVKAGAEGGANIFTLDYFGEPAYLTQSPQFYKQIMVGIFERVFEVGPAFRAEEHNTARHLNEYTSLDFEMGFIDSFRDVTRMENDFLIFMFDKIKEECADVFEEFKMEMPDVPKDIPSMKLREAQQILEDKFKRKCLNEPDFAPEEEKLICRYAKEELGSDFLFVTHFPTSKRPFYTMEDPEDMEYTLGFDLLFKGLEITTGGQRIHGYDMYIEKMKRLGMDTESFSFYLEAFKYGMPPHGGLAIGLERLTAKLLGLDNIREATLFPRDITRLIP